MKKELGKDKYGVQKSMYFFDYVTDGLGQVTMNALLIIVGQLTYFYTEKVGLAAGMVATMLLIAKVLDAFSDLVMGKILDMTHSPKGKCRPWFLWMTIPAFAILVLMFTVPKTIAPLQMIYVLVTNILISAVVYTAIAIPYNSLMAYRTESPEERGKMGIVRAVFAYIIGTVISMFLIPITNSLGGDQAAFIKFGVVLGLIAALALLIVYVTSKENARPQENIETKEKGNLKEEISYLFKNKYWVIMLIVATANNANQALTSGILAYYCGYVLGDDNLMAIVGMVGMLPMLAAFVLSGPITKLLGLKRATEFACVLGIIGGIIRICSPYNLVVMMVGNAFFSFSNFIITCTCPALLSNCVEYNELKFGKGMVGLCNSANSFGAKIGVGVGSSSVGWLLALAGYSSGAAVQPSGVITMIIVCSIIIPIVVCIIMLLSMRKYDLEKIYPEILKELREKRSQTTQNYEEC